MRLEDEFGGNRRGCSDPKYCQDGSPRSTEELMRIRSEGRPCSTCHNTKTRKTSPPISTPAISLSAPNPIGIPTDPGNFLDAYVVPGGETQTYHINGANGNGGGSLSVNYSAIYDVKVYENLLVINMHERYYIPAFSLPHYEDEAFGYSVLYSQLSNGIQVVTDLDKFAPGNISKPLDMTSRDTQITYWGQDNFPSQLVIEIMFGASNLYTSTGYYQLLPP